MNETTSEHRDRRDQELMARLLAQPVDELVYRTRHWRSAGELWDFIEDLLRELPPSRPDPPAPGQPGI